MIELWDYQNVAVNAIRRFFKKGGLHVLLASPTGSGKTVIFSYIAENVIKKKKKVLILTDRDELLKQTGSTLTQFGVEPFYIKAGTRFLSFDSSAYVAMIQTLRNRIKNPMWVKWLNEEIDLIVIDEAHLQTVNYLFESGLIDEKKVIGFTATPKRTGKMRQLGLDYEEIIETVSVKELVNRGKLVSDDYFGIKGVDTSNMKIDAKRGDYDTSEMFDRFDSPTLYAGVVKNWMDVAKDTQTLVFCVNIEHAIQTCEEFQKNGIDARFLVSGVIRPKKPEEGAKEGLFVRYNERKALFNNYTEKYKIWSGERSSMIKGFKNKEFKVLINPSMLTAGFDCPEIETVIVNRASSSLTLWYQMIGRGSRISPGKTHFNILDFGDNASRLGHYTAVQHWQLWHGSSDSGDGVAPVKYCGDSGIEDKNGKKGCQRMILATYPICPFCGYIYPKKKAVDIDLKAIMYDNVTRKAVVVKKVKDMDINELYDYYKKKGHKPPWFWRQLYFKGGPGLINKFGSENKWSNGTIKKAVNYVNGLK